MLKEDEGNIIICQICFKLKHSGLEFRSRFDHSYQSDGLPRALAAMTFDDGKDLNFSAGSGATTSMINEPGNYIMEMMLYELVMVRVYESHILVTLK